MEIYELNVNVELRDNIYFLEAFNQLSDFINYLMLYDKDLKIHHKKKAYKYYCFSSLYPFAQDKTYKKDKNYSFIIRTIQKDFIAAIMTCITRQNHFRAFKITKFNYSEKKLRDIHELVSITPAILTTQEGYWIKDQSTDLLKRRIEDNLFKKYKAFCQKELDESVNIIEDISLINRKPIKVPYKNMHMLGNKFKITVARNAEANLLANMALGTGILEKNSIGMGFCFANYKKTP